MASKHISYLNRELSWLEFNRRVLNEAEDDSVPLLERMNFLAITASNLDEFFMVRVGGLYLMVEDGMTKPDASGMTPLEQLEKVSFKAREMVNAQYSLFRDVIRPQLQAAGINILRPEDLNEEQGQHISRYFEDEILPIYSPIAIEGPDNFPVISNLGLNVVARLRNKTVPQKPVFAVIPLGPGIRRFVQLPGDGSLNVIPVESIIQTFLDRYFPGADIAESAAFRITRNADLSVNDEMVADFLAEMEGVLSRRKESGCVRLEVDRPVSRQLNAFFLRVTRVKQENIYEVQGGLDLADLRELYAREGFSSLRYASWIPRDSLGLKPGQSIFTAIAKQDILLSHPYDSFDPVVRMVTEAAGDPDVLAIKQTLYRTSSDSPVVAALRLAAESGKTVTAIVEVKARFDEERNIEWARELERSGVQVLYGVRGLKTHAKICIVVRREPQGIVRYMHFGTGNYNDRTARLYTDIGLLTCNPDLGADATAFFNAVTGYSEPQQFLKIAAAPLGLRQKIISLIDGAASRSQQGQKAEISAKMNSLVDQELIARLCKASQAGVKIRLNVRGVCCLRPGIKDVSENIAVISIVDRYLEHSRIFHFHVGQDHMVYISSADWMPRNLDRRVELMVPVEDPACRAGCIAILEQCFKDTAKASRLLPDGRYERLEAGPGKRKGLRVQEALYREACERAETADQKRRTTLEPLRPAKS
jgi:polyphosphate kinase